MSIAVKDTMGDSGEPLNYSVAEGFFFLSGLCHIEAGFFQSLSHTHYGGDIFGACALSALLRSAEDKAFKGDALSGIEDACTFGTVEFMGGKGEHIYAVIADMEGEVTCCLDGVSMEDDTLTAAEGCYFRNGKNCTDLVIGIHNGDEAGIFTQGIFHLTGSNEPVFAYI